LRNLAGKYDGKNRRNNHRKRSLWEKSLGKDLFEKISLKKISWKILLSPNFAGHIAADQLLIILQLQVVGLIRVLQHEIRVQGELGTILLKKKGSRASGRLG
jgi:hypothetical protein